VTLFQTIDPLLKEHKAISVWISQQPEAEQMEWLAVLPEVLSVDEAMVIAQGENHLLTAALLGKLRAAFGK
jgi:type II secretory pathway component PulM